MRTLVLWDVDHTLIENGGVSKETYSAAFEILTGTPSVSRPRTDGRTDPAIMQDLFRSNGIRFTPAHEAQLSGALVEAMRRNKEALASRGYALPGAMETLEALSADSTFVQSVLTGNIVENARAKLEPFGLDTYIDFEVGGYGSDHSVRSALVGVAQRRAAAKYGGEFDQRSTVLVGDTVRDVDAALDGGAQVIAVATGIDAVNTLRGAGAHEVLADLTDLGEFKRALARLVDS